MLQTVPAIWWLAVLTANGLARRGDGRESRPASDDEKALFNSDKYTSTMKVTYVNVVALYIPLASSGEQITAVGADRQPVKVEAL